MVLPLVKKERKKGDFFLLQTGFLGGDEKQGRISSECREPITRGHGCPCHFLYFEKKEEGDDDDRDGRKRKLANWYILTKHSDGEEKPLCLCTWISAPGDHHFFFLSLYCILLLNIIRKGTEKKKRTVSAYR